jgi:excisionase family DNA binding protein
LTCTAGIVIANSAQATAPARLIPNPPPETFRYSPTEAINQVERKTISIMKACELVGVSRRTIYNWLSSGKIEYVRTAGGSVRIFVDTLWRDPHREEPATVVEPTWQAEGRNRA